MMHLQMYKDYTTKSPEYMIFPIEWYFGVDDVHIIEIVWVTFAEWDFKGGEVFYSFQNSNEYI